MADAAAEASEEAAAATAVVAAEDAFSLLPIPSTAPLHRRPNMFATAVASFLARGDADTAGVGVACCCTSATPCCSTVATTSELRRTVELQWCTALDRSACSTTCARCGAIINARANGEQADDDPSWLTSTRPEVRLPREPLLPLVPLRDNVVDCGARAAGYPCSADAMAAADGAKGDVAGMYG